MLIVQELDKIPYFPKMKGLIIGNFDGVHLGHHYLINTLRKEVGDDGTIALFTFSNHPSSVFGSLIDQITTLEHKLKLLESKGVDLVILQKFSQDFAETTYDEFIKKLHWHFPFGRLVLGKGASFGKNKEGDETHVKEIEKQLSFQSLYLPRIEKEGIAISSKNIRSLIREGNLEIAAKLLGRPYSLLLRLERGEHFDLRGLCLPPEGSYPVLVRSENIEFKTQAHLSCQISIDELDSKDIDLGSWIEIIFC